MIVFIAHLNDVPWFKARPPFVLHRHVAQTTAYDDEDGSVVQRCACGAFGDSRGRWVLIDRPRRRWTP